MSTIDDGSPSNGELELWNKVKLRLLLAGVDADEVAELDAQREEIRRTRQVEPDRPPVFGSPEWGQPNEAFNLMRSRLLWSAEPRITIAEVARRAGLDIEVTRRARMLLGLPDPGEAAVCRVEEVEAFRGLAGGIEMYGTDTILQYTRVIGSALTTVAEGALTVFARSLTLMAESDEPVPEGDEFTLLTFDALESFNTVPQVLQVASKLLFEQAIEQLGADPGSAHLAAVGFVDLIGSTITTEELGDDAMTSALARFEEWSAELAVASGGRVVKYIGDEVMFVTPDLSSATHVAVELLKRIADDPVLRRGRAGIAHGEVLNRDGDWFGATVNKAARLVDKARQGTILLTGEGAAEVEGAAHKGRRRLRGMSERVEVWRLDCET